jgi:hypothetical protein
VQIINVEQRALACKSTRTTAKTNRPRIKSRLDARPATMTGCPDDNSNTVSPDISPACPEQVKSVIVYVKAGGYHFGAAHGA